MATLLVSTTETPEEAEARRRASTAFRIKVLVGISVLVIAARVFIKDPERKAPIDYTKAPVKIVPGMLDTLPASARANIEPQLLAKMVLADEMARRGEFGKPPAETEAAKVEYRPAEAPTERDVEAEAYKEQIFAYARKRRIDTLRRDRIEQQSRDTRKSTLVRFASGGFVHAEAAERRRRDTYIRIDKNLEADLPNSLVSSVRNDALGWNEPVPAGKVKLRPARGITVILFRDTARRVTVEKTSIDEI